jgi:hypothetical protein
MHECGCQTAGGIKAHGAHYAGFDKNYCNQCRCHAGVEVCTTRQCNVAATATLCASTTCQYGIRFAGTDALLSKAEAISTVGTNWENQPYEMTTMVKHDSADANGAKFSCGHVMHTEECRCYCSDSGTHHIWHRAERHADAIAKGLTAAGCTCQDNWTHRGQTYNGCQNPTHSPNPLLDTSSHGEKREAWCKIVPGSCSAANSFKDAVKAGADWDTCEEVTHLHLKIPARL